MALAGYQQSLSTPPQSTARAAQPAASIDPRSPDAYIEREFQAWLQSQEGQDYASYVKAGSPLFNIRLGDTPKDPSAYGPEANAAYQKMLRDEFMKRQGNDKLSAYNAQLADPDYQQKQQDIADQRARQQYVTDQQRAMYEKYNRPEDPSSPEMQRFQQQVGNAAGANAYGRGLGTRGLAGANTQDILTSALLDRSQQRQGLAMSALNAMNSRDLDLSHLNDQERQTQADTQYQNELAKYQQRQQQASGTGALIGGVAGAIPGVLLAPYTGGASLGLIGAGSAIGGGIGGLTAGKAPTKRNYGTGY